MYLNNLTVNLGTSPGNSPFSSPCTTTRSVRGMFNSPGNISAIGDPLNETQNTLDSNDTDIHNSIDSDVTTTNKRVSSDFQMQTYKIMEERYKKNGVVSLNVKIDNSFKSKAICQIRIVLQTNKNLHRRQVLSKHTNIKSSNCDCCETEICCSCAEIQYSKDYKSFYESLYSICDVSKSFSECFLCSNICCNSISQNSTKFDNTTLRTNDVYIINEKPVCSTCILNIISNKHYVFTCIECCNESLEKRKNVVISSCEKHLKDTCDKCIDLCNNCLTL